MAAGLTWAYLPFFMGELAHSEALGRHRMALSLRRQEKALLKQIEFGLVKHLALEHFQAVDMAFDQALAPGRRHRRLDGGQVRPEPFGKAPEGRLGARGCMSQPGFDLGWLAPRTREAKSCARATASANSADCWVSCANW